MSKRIKGITIEIDGSTTGLQKALEDVNKKSNSVTKELRDIDRLLKFSPGNTELVAQKQRLLAEQIENTSEKLKRLKDAQADVDKQFAEGKINQTQYDAFQREIVETESKLKHFETQLASSQSKLKAFGDSAVETGNKMQSVGDGMKNVGKDLSLKVTAPIVAIGGAAVKSAMDFESAFAGVRKTVDATEDEFKVLSEGIRGMAKEIPVAATEIAGVAEAAGQLGIQKESILGFTRTMVDLGVATNMTSDEAATALARLANITQMPQTEFDRLGASIVDLGNNFATTEREIVDMSLRLAGAGAQVGMSEADILALATALSSVGIEAEMGGSAISRVMVNMQVATSTGFTKVQDLLSKTGLSLRDLQMMASHSGKAFGNLAEDLGMTKKELSTLVDAGLDLENFSKIAGMTGEQFKKTFEQDAIGALGAFINGLANAEASGDSAINMLQEMGITEIRLRDSLLRAGGAAELFANAVDISNNAWEENVALTNEAEERYKTFESQLTIFVNTLKDMGITIGNIILPFLNNLMDSMKPVIEYFANMSEDGQKLVLVLGAIVAAVGPLLVILGTLVASLGAVFTAIGTFSGAMAVATTGAAAATPAVGALAAVISALTGPIGIAVAAIAGITAALVLAYNKVEWFRDGVDKVWEAIKSATQKAFEAVKETISTVIEAAVKFGSEQLETFKKFWDENGKAIMDLVKKYFNLVLSDIKMVMGLIQGVFQTVWPIISGVVKTVWAVIKSIVSTSINTVLGVIQTVLKLLQGDWSGAWETIKTTASTIMDNIIKYFKDIDLLQVGKDIIQGLIDGIGSMANAVVEKVKTLADSIPNWIKKVLGIHSPSRVTKKLGEETGAGLAIGITNTQKQVTKATDGVAKAVDTGFTKTMQRITKQAEQAASGTKKSTDRIKKSFKEAFDAVKHEYESGNFTATQYVKALESVGSRYAKTADAQRKISAEMLKMEKEAAKEREEIDKKTFEKTKSFIEARRQANEISLTQELAAWERVHDRYKQGSDERIEAEKNIQRVRQEIYDQLLQANDEFLKKTQEINKNVEDEEKRLNEVYEKAVEERTRSIRDFAGLFDEVVFKAEKTGDDLINNLKGQVSYIDQWSYSIEQLAKRGIDDGLLEELRAMGPKAMPELMALNSLTDSKLKEYESLWKKKTEQARSIALKEMSGLKTDTEKQISELHKNAEKQLEAVRKEFDSKVKSIRFGAEDEFSAMKSTLPDIGKEAIRGLQSGLENMRGPLMKTARGIADEVASTIRKALQVKSPSRVTTEIGEFVGEGLMVGMENMLDDIKRVAARMGSFAVPTIPDVAMGAVSGGGFTSNRNVSQSQESNQTFLIQPTPIYLDGQIIGEAVFDVVDVKMDSKRTSQLRYGGWKK